MSEQNPEIKLCECGCRQPAPIATATDTKQGYIKNKPKHFIKGHHNKGKKRHAITLERMSRALKGKNVKYPWPSEKIEIAYCKCGCGKSTTMRTDGRFKGTFRLFIKGHSNRIRGCLPETREKISQTLKKLGAENAKLIPVPTEIKLCACGCGQPITRTWERTHTRKKAVRGQFQRFIQGHQMIGRPMSDATKDKHRIGSTGRRLTLEQRENILRRRGREPVRSPYIPDTLIYFASKQNRWLCRVGKKRTTHARAVFEYFNGPIPTGFMVHHRSGCTEKFIDDHLDNLMLLPSVWNRDIFPVLSKGFNISESQVTDAYCAVYTKDKSTSQLFKAITVLLLEQTNQQGNPNEQKHQTKKTN